MLLRGDVFDHVWAEDGKVFLAGAQQHGLASLTYLYAGYVQFIPRTLALAGESLLPLRDYAFYAVFVSAVIVGALAAFVYLIADEVLESPAAAAVAATGMVLAPAVAASILDSLTNLTWFFMFAALWAMLAPPDSARRRLASVVAGLTALGTPLAVLVAPAALVAHGPRGALRSRPLRALLAGLALQLVAIAFFPRTSGGPHRSGLTAKVVRKVAESLFRAVLAPSQGPKALLAPTGVLVAGLLVAALALSRGRPRLLAAVSLFTGLLIYCITCFITGGTPTRYVAVATIFVIGAFACLLPALDWRVATAAVSFVLLICAVSFVAPAHRVSGPRWSSEITRHDAECRRSHPAATTVQISPSGSGVWTVRLDC